MSKELEKKEAELNVKDLERVTGGDGGPTHCPHAFQDCPNLSGGTCQWFGTDNCVNGILAGGITPPA